jgi:hypothetical protein
MSDPTNPENGTPPYLLSDHEIALVMAALRVVGKSKYDPDSIQQEYSTALEWLKEFRRQAEAG